MTEDKSFLHSPSLVGRSAGVSWSLRQQGSGSLASRHTQRHLPGKSKSSAVEASPSSLIWKPLGLNEQGKNAEVSIIMHLQGGSTEKRS